MSKKCVYCKKDLPENFKISLCKSCRDQVKENSKKAVGGVATFAVGVISIGVLGKNYFKK